MAQVKGLNKITGKFANASFYTIQGGDQVYVRSKGGPTKRAIKTKPQFEKLRRNNSEWKACTKMGGSIRYAYFDMKHLEDYPVIGALNAIAKKIQLMDEEGEHGKRSIYLSRHRALLGGFSLSRKQVLESVLRVPIDALIDRESMTARISLPPIDTRMYLYNFRNLPYFRLFFQLGGESDWKYNEENKSYAAVSETYWKGESSFCTDWMSTSGTTAAINQLLRYNQETPPLEDSVTLLLTMGLEFGKQGPDGKPEGVKYAGCGKILRVG
ncbi:MAG: hypothetical protein WCJ03_06785 [Bacteroidales bacterium]